MDTDTQKLKDELVKRRERIKTATSIGMAYLMYPGANADNLRYGIEAMLTMITGSDTIKQFRERYRDPQVPLWKDGVPL